MSKILSNEINPIAFAEAFTVEPKMRGSPGGSAIGSIPKCYAIRKSMNLL